MTTAPSERLLSLSLSLSLSVRVCVYTLSVKLNRFPDKVQGLVIIRYIALEAVNIISPWQRRW